MPARKSKKWQSRRKPSLGQLRRAHPASGATWNVQVVRGKMTSKCLWHACRALILGILLMLLGASMATIGYYADHLSMGHEIRGNATVRVKNESRGFHLNNLSYVGPIVMGFGGFIVVAACVMTFEARDSAAKVVPARFKISTSNRSNIKSNSSSGASNRRANGIMHQATRWDHHLGVFRTSPADPPAPEEPIDRQALTAALIHFSKTLKNSPRQSPRSRRFSLSGSVPNLPSALTSNRSSINSARLSPLCRRQHHHYINNAYINSLASKQLTYQQFQQLQEQQQQQHHHRSKHHHRHRHYHHNDEVVGNDDDSRLTDKEKIIGYNYINSNGSNKAEKKHRLNGIIAAAANESNSFSKTRTSRTSSSLIYRTSRRDTNSGSLLHPGKLHQMHRHAMSVDESGPYVNASDIDDYSLISGIMLENSHEQRIKDRNRRSDTAKRHILSRQKPIEREEQINQQNSSASRYEERRRSSTTSDASYTSRFYRASTATSRTNSIDSRSIQVELHSPEKQQQQYYYQNRASPRSPRRQSSTPSADREIRSQLSVCSEPTTIIRQLSRQSSLEPCVLEESPELEDKDRTIAQINSNSGNFTMMHDNDEETNSLSTISANIHEELYTPKHNNRTRTNKCNNTSNSPIYCNIRKQRPQSLKINTNHAPVIKSNGGAKITKPTTAAAVIATRIDEKNKLLQRSNSSSTFYRQKPKLINEYENVNRSSAAENSSSISGGGGGSFNYYNSFISTGRSCSNDDDFYDSLRVINERRNKILKTESELNSQNKTIETDIAAEELKEKQVGENEIKNKDLTNNEKDLSYNILSDVLKTNTCNSINNLDSSKEGQHLNNKETDDNVKENSNTVTIAPQHQLFLTEIEKNPNTIISSHIHHKTNDISQSASSILLDKMPLAPTPSSASPSSECDTNTKIVEIPIDRKTENECKCNISICNNSSNKNSSSNGYSCCTNNNNCDISNSNNPGDSSISCGSSHVCNLHLNIEINSESQLVPTFNHSHESNTSSNVVSCSDRINLCGATSLENSEKKINSCVLKTDNNIDDKVIIKNDKRIVDDDDHHDDSSDNRIESECPKDTVITIHENVN